MKKILCIILTIILISGFLSCNALLIRETDLTSTEETTTTSTKETTTTEQTSTEEVTTETITTEDVLPEEGIVTINLFSINDFHGGAYTGIDLISGIGSYLKSVEGHKISVSNGDIFQGSAISNYYYGRLFVDIFNDIGFDGFVIGNHEFDWGIEKIGEYKDDLSENGELNHPVLAANIVYEDTQEALEFTQPYFIEEFEGVKVGVIGMIGQISDSIAASRTENIIFLDPVLTAGKYAQELREDHDVQIVVVYIHDGSWNNDEFAELSGNMRIDAMFNGHSHQDESRFLNRQDGSMKMPYAQMNNYTTSLVNIQLSYDLGQGKLVSSVTDEVSGQEVFYPQVSGILTSELEILSDQSINLIIDSYENDQVYQSFIGEILTDSQSYYNRGNLSEWGASVIRDYAGVDIGAMNSGGFRVSIDAGSFTMGDLITVYPFDNIIKTSEMTGQQIQDFYLEIQNDNEDVVFDDGLYYNYNTSRLEINGSPIVLDQYYTVGAVDYIFDKNKYDFIEGKNIIQTIYFMRDLLVDDLRNEEDSFNPYEGTNHPG